MLPLLQFHSAPSGGCATAKKPCSYAKKNQALPASYTLIKISWRPCGLMDKALVFGTKDCRFESCQGHGSDEVERWKREGEAGGGRDKAHART